MASLQRRIRIVAVIVAAGLVAWTGTAGGATAREMAERRFDIPAQPLDEALTRFATLTGLQLLYDSSLAAGKTAGRVDGVMEPRQALTGLLNGTGLSARFTSAGAVVIYAAASGAVTLNPITAVAAPVVGGQGASAADRLYAEAVQRRVVEALRREAALSDRDYVIGVRLWLGAGGETARTEVLSGSGDPARDAGFIDFMRRLRFDPPPVDLPQPMRMEFRVRRDR